MSAEKLSNPGALPRMEWLAPDCFVIDRHYQRHTESDRSKQVINSITKNFLWARWQPPTVTPVKDKKGKYLVIDGQHRIKAAQQRPDIKKVPVYIVDNLTMQEQAQHFVAINQDRVILNPLAIYHAQVAYGDPEAMKIRNICEEADIIIPYHPIMFGSTKPRETQAIGSIRTGLKKYGEENVLAALMIIPEVYKLVPGMMKGFMLKALMHFFKKHGIRNIDRKALKSAIGLLGPDGYNTGASRYMEKNKGSKHDAILALMEKNYNRFMEQAREEAAPSKAVAARKRY